MVFNISSLHLVRFSTRVTFRDSCPLSPFRVVVFFLTRVTFCECTWLIFKPGPILGLLSMCWMSVSQSVCLHLIPPLSLEEFEEKELSISKGREPNVRRRKSLGTRSLHRDQMTPSLLQEYFTSVLYYTICGRQRRL